MARNQLAVDSERYNALCFTDQSRAVVRGEVPVPMRALAAERPRERVRQQRNSAAVVSGGESYDEALFQALRTVRKNIALEARVPPYVIFHDDTLQNMAALKPKTLDDMAHVRGVGAHKLERYGPAFLNAVIAADPTMLAATES